MKKKVAVLGATGSIGKNALDVMRANKDRFQPVLFSANSNQQALLALKNEFPQAATVLAADSQAQSEGLLNAIAAAGAHITVNGIAGAAGLLPSVAALQSGSDLALANKETVVIAGQAIFDLAAEKKRQIIPVDSEHSAIFKLIHAFGSDNVSEIILTASGGPFRNYSREQLAGVTVEQALAHPTWSMGKKITIDSATLANKGLEVIEAALFFGFTPEKIKVVIHAQSIVHSMIRLKDGAVYAQMSNPDMRLPIHDALWWPETSPSPFGALDFENLTLTFEKCETEQFPMLAMAYRALEAGALFPAIFNAANEIAVQAFLEKSIGFLEIPRIVMYAMNEGHRDGAGDGIMTIDNALEWDRKSRSLAEKCIEEMNGR